MKINKILFLMIFPLITEVVISCCHCMDPLIAHYTNKTITASNLDNSGNYPIVTSSSTVHRDAYGIRILIGREKTARITPHTSIFIQTTYAFSCDCPPSYEILGRDSITAMQVFTLNNFDTNHAANSEVSDYFRIFSYGNNSFSTIPEFLKASSTILYDDKDLEQNFDILLMNPPTTTNMQQFKVILTLSDGRTLENETTPITFI